MPLPTGGESIAFSIIAPTALYNTVKSMLTAMLPNLILDGGGRKIHVSSQYTSEGLNSRVDVEGCEKPWVHVDREVLSPDYDAKDRLQRQKERVRYGVLTVISREYKLAPRPWGTLTGVRPTKLVHQLYERGFCDERITYILSDVYGVSDDRLNLLQEISKKQRPFFHPSPNQPVSLYVGIPFCPTRCGYCSFAAYPLKSHGHLLAPYLKALLTEITVVGETLVRLGVEIESVYLGGGTPTTVRGADLTSLLTALRSSFAGQKWREFTVEAGRPETIDEETVTILTDHGVDRISINPQTMNDQTLARIGRNHQASQVVKAYDLCYNRFSVINMDIILGLPGEELKDIAYTLEQIGKLGPENLTVHSLARKRASEWSQKFSELAVAQQQGVMMADLVRQTASSWGLEPYYLYRQRSLLSDLENIGFSSPGTESIYNIMVMEERQSIIGVGAGAITKFVHEDYSLQRQSNAKCPATYINQLSQHIAAKKHQLCQHFAV